MHPSGSLEPEGCTNYDQSVMANEFTGDPDHWRERAKEARAWAEKLEGERKHIMLRIARDYDLLVERAEQRQRRA